MRETPTTSTTAAPSTLGAGAGRRDRMIALAAHEVRAATRSRVLTIFTAVLVVAAIGSVAVGSADLRSQLADYTAYKAAAAASGVTTVAPPPFAVLTLLRGSLEYLEIIGAVIAIAVGYLSIARERLGRTLPLLRSRPVTPGEQTLGMVLGATILFSGVAGATALASYLALGLIGGAWPTGLELPKMALAYVAAVVYLVTFYCLGAVLTAKARVPANGLVLALGVWLVVVLVLPQIGDTMDADNQLPGGLFAALGLGHQGEVAILAHFQTYETLRNFIESMSLEKHFERFAFAMTDIKPRYRDLGLSGLFDVAKVDVVFMTAALIALGLWLRRSLSRQHLTSTTERKPR